MHDQKSSAVRAIATLSECIAGGGVLDPTDPRSVLLRSVRGCINATTDGPALFDRFLQAPADADVCAVLVGRLTEAVLADPSYGGELAAAVDHVANLLHPAEPPVGSSKSQSLNFAGTMKRSAMVQGDGSIDQSKRIRISFPVAGIALLASGVLVGGGVVVYNAATGSSDAGHYSFYSGPDGDPASSAEYSLYDWDTQSDGSIRGNVVVVAVGPDSDDSSIPVSLAGRQEGKNVDFTASALGIEMALHGTISGDEMVLRVSTPDDGLVTVVTHRTTPEEFDRITHQQG